MLEIYWRCALSTHERKLLSEIYKYTLFVLSFGNYTNDCVNTRTNTREKYNLHWQWITAKNLDQTAFGPRETEETKENVWIVHEMLPNGKRFRFSNCNIFHCVAELKCTLPKTMSTDPFVPYFNVDFFFCVELRIRCIVVLIQYIEVCSALQLCARVHIIAECYLHNFFHNFVAGRCLCQCVFDFFPYRFFPAPTKKSYLIWPIW